MRAKALEGMRGDGRRGLRSGGAAGGGGGGEKLGSELNCIAKEAEGDVSPRSSTFSCPSPNHTFLDAKLLSLH